MEPGPAGGREESTVRRDHTLSRRVALATLASPILSARAQPAFPSRPIRIISPYPPGGGTDTTARLLAPPLGRILGQSIVVENKAGASGSIGAAEVARAVPDGHTLLVDAMAHVVNPTLMRGLTFDYIRGFAPISQVTVLPQVMVAPLALPPTLAPSPMPAPTKASWPSGPPAMPPASIWRRRCSYAPPACTTSSTCPSAAGPRPCRRC